MVPVVFVFVSWVYCGYFTAYLALMGLGDLPGFVTLMRGIGVLLIDFPWGGLPVCGPVVGSFLGVWYWLWLGTCVLVGWWRVDIIYMGYRF